LPSLCSQTIRPRERPGAQRERLVRRHRLALVGQRALERRHERLEPLLDQVADHLGVAAGGSRADVLHRDRVRRRVVLEAHDHQRHVPAPRGRQQEPAGLQREQREARDGLVAAAAHGEDLHAAGGEQPGGVGVVEQQRPVRRQRRRVRRGEGQRQGHSFRNSA
jgi:hypothetical protein